MQATKRTGERLRGITLLELLIVMVIMLMVTAAAIPMVAPALRNRQMREATRLVSSYFGAARARAVQTGRPVGIVVERFNGGAFALQLSQIEVPPPYSGDVIDARTTSVFQSNPAGTLTEQRAINAGWNYRAWFMVLLDPALFNHRLVRVGDILQLGAQGQQMIVYGPDEPPQGSTIGDGVIDAPASGSPVTLEVAYCSHTPYVGKVFLPWPATQAEGNSCKVVYRVFRQPVRSSAQPLVLPTGIVVDLSVSGVGSERFNITDYSANIGGTVPAPLVTVDPIVIFSPSGRLDYVTNRFGQLVRPLASVNLLLGRRELMFDVTTKGDSKDIVFQNLGPVPTPNATTLMPPAENFWITIGYQTGQVSVSQVAPSYQNFAGTSMGGVTFSNQQSVIDFTLYGSVTPAYSGALTFARESQSLGGR